MLWVQVLLAAVYFTVALDAAEKPPDSVTVCEAINHPDSYDHKIVFLMGRVSKRTGSSGGSERWVEEESCEGTSPTNTAALVKVRIQLNRETAPKPPDQLAIDVTETKRKFDVIEQHTTIHQFRFGSGDYEEWGIVFGRLEMERSTAAGAFILCRGEALIFPWSGR
jgi:hypothetical protein